MNTNLFVSAEILLNVSIILLFNYFLKRVSGLRFMLLALLELTLIYAVAELFNQFHYYLRDKGVAIELGHASILGVLILLVSFLTALAFIVVCGVRKTGK